MKFRSKYQSIYFFTYRYYLIATTLTLKEITSRIQPFLLARIPNLPYLFKSKLYISIIKEYANRNFSRVITLLDQLPKQEFDEQIFLIAKNTHLLSNNKIEAQRYLDELFIFMGINIEIFLFSKIENTTELKLNHQFIIRYGMTNVGLIEHLHNESIKYITKIKRFSQHPSNKSLEVHLYKGVSPYYPSLSEHISTFISYENVKDLGLLTLEYVHGRKPQIEDIEPIKDFQREIMKINYQEFRKLTPNNMRFYFLDFKSFLISKNRKTLKNSISVWSTSMLRYFDSQKIVEDKKVLHQVFIRNRALNSIDIKRDFVFQHRDFGPHNSKINYLGKLMVYDWEGFGLNIPGTDLLKFILFFTHDFNYIKEHVFTSLSEEGIHNHSAITCCLVHQYLEFLTNPRGFAYWPAEGQRIQENWNLAIDYLKKSPFYN